MPRIPSLPRPPRNPEITTMRPAPADDPDERLCEFLADRVIDLVSESYPNADAFFRRRAARLLLSQVTGRERPPRCIPMARLARRMGWSQQQVSAIECRALLKLRVRLEEQGLTFDDLISLTTPPTEP